MIDIGFAEFFVIVLTACMVHLAVLWVRENQRVKRNDWQLSNRRLFHCNYCHHTFIPKQPVSLCRCPRCNTVCILRKYSAMIARRENSHEEEK